VSESLGSVVLEKQTLAKLPEVRKAVASYLTQPVVRVLATTFVTPNTLTWFGFLLSAGATALIVTEHLFAAGFVVLACTFAQLASSGVPIMSRKRPFAAPVRTSAHPAS